VGRAEKLGFTASDAAAYAKRCRRQPNREPIDVFDKIRTDFAGQGS